MDSYIDDSKLPTLFLALPFSLEQKTDKSIDCQFLPESACQKLFLHIQASWMATYMI
jgi:hypothetical protein